MSARAAVFAAALLAISACGGSESTPAAPAPAPSAPSATPAAPDPEPVTLTVLSALNRDAAEHQGLFMYIDRLAEAAPWITLQYVGGPEVEGTFDSMEAVKEGRYDIVDTSPAFYDSILPAAKAFLMRNRPPSEERTDGTYDLLQEYYDDINVHMIGTTVPSNLQFQVYLGTKGGTIDANNFDLTGFTIRGGTQYAAAVLEFGGVMINMPFGEVYTSMERGVIDGFGAGAAGIYALGVADVTKYEIVPEFKAVTYCLCINKDRWNSLEPVTQEAMTAVMIELERDLVAMWDEIVVDEKAKRRADGIGLIELQGATAERWLNAANEGTWVEALAVDPRVANLKTLWGY